MTVTRANVDFAKRIGLARVGNDYVYGGCWRADDDSVGTDCSGLVIAICDAVRNGSGMAWSRHGMSTESWRPIEIGQTGTMFDTVTVGHPDQFPADAVVKIALHHGPGGGANSHMWCEVDGVRLESNGSDGCVTGAKARSVNDTAYANDWAYIPGPITSTVGPDPVQVLSDAMGGAVSRDRYAALLPAVADCLRACSATTVDRIAMWCAQIGHESGGLKWMEELADGSAYEGRADLGNTQPGDGPRFKGRGPIQVTGRNNYASLSRWAAAYSYVPSATFFTDAPEQLASDRYGFLGVAWYWIVARPQLNAYADACDLEVATRAINGGLNGIDDRRARYRRALALGDELLILTTTTTGDDMAQVPQDQWDLVFRELTQRLPSRSIYRTPGEGVVDTAAGMLLNVDAMSHAAMVERLARLGDRDALTRIALVAAGKGAVTDPQAVAQARAVLADIENTNPTVLQDFLTTTKG